MQSESSLSGFAEAQPFFEAKPQRTPDKTFVGLNLHKNEL